MNSQDNLPIKLFGPEQSAVLYKILIFQKLCPGKCLVTEPWPADELSDEEMEKAKDTLRQLMPLDTMVTNMWDWGIRFEDFTFEDCFFDVAIASEDFAMAQAEYLKEDIIRWIDEYDMDYAEEQFEAEGFEKWILDQCKAFILKWRNNIKDKYLAI